MLAAAFPNVGIGLLGVSLAFGLTVLTMAFAIELCLTLIHLISIPVTNTSVNPARSTGVAVFVGDWAITQLWLFWVAPIAGGVIGASVDGARPPTADHAGGRAIHRRLASHELRQQDLIVRWRHDHWYPGINLKIIQWR